MLDQAQEFEGRGELRAETFGRALIMADDVTAVAYRLDNLSAGGALLSDGPMQPLWKTYRLVLLLDGLPAVEVKARAVWQTEEVPPRLGVSFEHLDTTVQDMIHDVVLGILSGQKCRAPLMCGDKLPSWLS